jgi:AraC-like DNA-binding protein
MERFRLAILELSPTRISIGDGDLTRDMIEWVEPIDRWRAIYYHHGNAVALDGTLTTIEPDTIVFFPPGIHGAHTRVGDDTYHHYLSFNLPATEGARLAIPLVVPNMSRILPDLRRAAERVSSTPRPTIAFAWNLVWSVALNPAVIRGRHELYAAEDWIMSNLNRRFSVPELAAAVGTSPRTLLTAFREEHRCTVQEYVRRKRVQEAGRLLASTNSSIKEIAFRVGIPDLQAFNKIIRMELGCSPRAFRGITRPRP